MSRVVCLVYIDGIFLFLNQVTIYVFSNDVIFFKIQLFFQMELFSGFQFDSD